jgi:hypothetical protein
MGDAEKVEIMAVDPLDLGSARLFIDSFCNMRAAMPQDEPEKLPVGFPGNKDRVYLKIINQ